MVLTVLAIVFEMKCRLLMSLYQTISVDKNTANANSKLLHPAFNEMEFNFQSCLLFLPNANYADTISETNCAYTIFLLELQVFSTSFTDVPGTPTSNGLKINFMQVDDFSSCLFVVSYTGNEMKTLVKTFTNKRSQFLIAHALLPSLAL